MMIAAFVMLVAAVISFIAHVVIVGAVFLVLMVLCGVAGVAIAMSGYRRLKEEQNAMLRDEAAYRQRRSSL